MQSFETRPKIFVIYPPNAEKLPGIKNIMFPLGTAYIASMLRSKYNVKCHDFNLDFALRIFSTNRIKKILKSFKYDFLLIGGVFPQYPCIKEIINISRSISNAKIIVGGSFIEPTLNHLQQYIEADYYVIGEGEHTIVELIDGLVNNTPTKDVSGIAYQNGKDFVSNKRPSAIGNLDDIPFPSRDLYEFDYYKRYFALGNPLRYLAHFIASRGCPLNCVFCKPGFGKIINVRSPENILEEIKLVQKDYNIDTIHFLDEVMLGGTKKNVANFCEYVLSKYNGKPDFFWMGNTNSRMLDCKTIKLMKRAGCFKIAFGVESGSKAILKDMRKNNDLEQLKEIVTYCKKLGMGVYFNLSTNTFNETAETLNETKEYLMHFNQFHFHVPNRFFFLVPIIGTALYREAKEKNLLSRTDIENIINSSTETKFALENNLTSMDKDEYLKLVNGVNLALHDDYYDKHKLQYLINKTTNLTHFRFNDSFSSKISDRKIKAIFEGLLWVICRGNEENYLGSIYKNMIYKDYIKSWPQVEYSSTKPNQINPVLGSAS